MPTYDVTMRTTSPTEIKSITANSPEQAIEKVVADAEEGESVEVMNVRETSPDSATPKAKEASHPAPAPAPAKK